MLDIVKESITITSFVFVMMLVIEYLDTLNKDNAQNWILKHPWNQYIVAALLGLLPGCLGAFVAVTMYTHRIISIGALVTTMIATSGDETFLMIALIPKTFILLSALLFVVSIFAGALIDIVIKKKSDPIRYICTKHKGYRNGSCLSLSRKHLINQWKHCRASRGILFLTTLMIFVSVLLGQIGPQEWNYIRITMLIIYAIAIPLIITASDHFLEEHLWKHIFLKHTPMIFVWTFAALAFMTILPETFQLAPSAKGFMFIPLLLACLIGLIPQSGPHIIFVTLFAQGSIPLSILIANSIVQDGHGMLPLLAHSRRDFIIVKLIKFILGIIVGSIMLLLYH